VFEKPAAARDRIRIRSLNLRRDFRFVSNWTSTAPESLEKESRRILKSRDAHCFICLSGTRRVLNIVIQTLVPNECGIKLSIPHRHCFMALLINPLFVHERPLTSEVLRSFLDYYFSFKLAQCLVVTPGIYDFTICRLLEASGFIFQQNVILPTEAASLYLITRNIFFATVKVDKSAG